MKRCPTCGAPNMNLMLVKAIIVALKEFDRISYQKKADPEVIKLLRLAIEKAMNV
jgi:hypothetical protein